MMVVMMMIMISNPRDSFAHASSRLQENTTWVADLEYSHYKSQYGDDDDGFLLLSKSLTDPSVLESDGDLEIRIIPDKANK